MENKFLNIFKIIMGTLLGPVHFFEFKESINFSISDRTVGERNIEFGELI